jgi:hypothetical protein
MRAVVIAATALIAGVTVWALGSCAHWLTAVAGAAITWLLGTGFLAHRWGELSWGSDDRGHLVVVALAAAVAILVSLRRRAAIADRQAV